jgi:pimeloyl-ACP methyl ester carboxylesterase
MKNLLRIGLTISVLLLGPGSISRGQDGSTSSELVSFPTQDGGLIYADSYGKGERAVVLAHGGQFNKESWKTQARALAKAGFRVLAIDFRGYGRSKGPGDAHPLGAPLHFDVLGAVRYLRKTGAKEVSIIGASMGGGAAGDASIEARAGEIDRLVFLGSLASLTGRGPEQVKGRKLFIMTRDDLQGGTNPRLPKLREQYDKVTPPKQLVILDGSAHAQFIFQTEQSEGVMREILKFLSEP